MPTVADKLQPDLTGTKMLRKAAELPYGTPYKETLELLSVESGRSPEAISKAIAYALKQSMVRMYPREAVAAMQLNK